MAKPLHNKIVVLTRGVAGNQAWTPYLTAAGAGVYSVPAIETKPIPPTPDTRVTLRELSTFDWLVFTSTASVMYLQKLTSQAGGEWPPQNVAVAAIGNHTAHATKASGLHVTFQPALASSTALGKELLLVHGKRILLPRTTIAPNDLPDLLSRRGAKVTTLGVYETRSLTAPNQELTRKLQDNGIDFLVFASPSAIRGFCQQVAQPYMQVVFALPAVAIGPEVAIALKGAGFSKVHTSATPSIQGIVEILQRLVR